MISAAIAQARVRGEEQQAHDPVRDISVARYSVFRGMRSQARPVGEIDPGHVAAARAVNRVD